MASGETQVLVKYVISLTPALLCTGIAAIYWHLSSKARRLRSGMELTPHSSENIGWIFLFAGIVFTAMSLACCVLSDVRTWEDRRQLRKSLGGDSR
jgi:hypothetical protein